MTGFAELAAALYPLRTATFADLSYAARETAAVSLFRPEAAEHPPIAILFHGGGWTRPGPAKNVVVAVPLMLAGWAVANVRYRLADEAPAPAAVEDAIAAIACVAEAADLHRYDRSRMVAIGISAGGHLALCAGLDPGGIVDGAGRSPLAAIIDLYGIADPGELLTGPAAQPFASAWLGCGASAAAEAERLSPLRMARAANGIPPIFIAHGTEDRIVPVGQSERLHAALRAAGHDSELLLVPGDHGRFEADARERIFNGMQRFLAARDLWPAPPSIS